jgi:hypothetical protein
VLPTWSTHAIVELFPWHMFSNDLEHSFLEEFGEFVGAHDMVLHSSSGYTNLFRDASGWHIEFPTSFRVPSR